MPEMEGFDDAEDVARSLWMPTRNYAIIFFRTTANYSGAWDGDGAPNDLDTVINHEFAHRVLGLLTDPFDMLLTATLDRADFSPERKQTEKRLAGEALADPLECTVDWAARAVVAAYRKGLAVDWPD